MPRKSATDLATPRPLVQREERADAPYTLTDRQAEVWHRVTGRLPADWFQAEHWDMLVAYCRHSVAADNVAQLISQHEGGDSLDVDEYDKLLKMQERESRALSSLATRMRITQQALKDPRTKPHKSVKKPWER